MQSDVPLSRYPDMNYRERILRLLRNPHVVFEPMSAITISGHILVQLQDENHPLAEHLINNDEIAEARFRAALSFLTRKNNVLRFKDLYDKRVTVYWHPNRQHELMGTEWEPALLAQLASDHRRPSKRHLQRAGSNKAKRIALMHLVRELEPATRREICTYNHSQFYHRHYYMLDTLQKRGLVELVGDGSDGEPRYVLTDVGNAVLAMEN